MGGDVGKVLKADPLNKFTYDVYKDITGSLKPPEFNMPEQEKVESVTTVTEAASDTKKKLRKPTGRGDSLLAGVANALKTRLGQ